MSTATSKWIAAALGIVAGIPGCKGGPERSGGAEGSSEPPSYTATVDGAEVKFKSVLAVSTGGTSLRLWLTNKHPSCADLRAYVQGDVVMATGAAVGREELEIKLASTIQKDGKRAWKVGDVRYDEKPAMSPQRYDAEVSAADPGGVVRLTLKEPLVLAESKIFNRPHEVKIALPGEIRALGCGVAPRPKGAVARAEPQLKVKVNGVEIPIRGAVWKKLPAVDLPGVHELVLSSEPSDCKDSLEGDFVVEVYVDAQATKATHLVLNGDATFNGNSQTDDVDGLKVKPLSDVAGAGDMALELSGRVKLPFDDAVEVTGSATAARCPS